MRERVRVIFIENYPDSDYAIDHAFVCDYLSRVFDYIISGFPLSVAMGPPCFSQVFGVLVCPVYHVGLNNGKQLILSDSAIGFIVFNHSYSGLLRCYRACKRKGAL